MVERTIFALSSGTPPAAIGIIRISGPDAGTALQSLSGKIPQPRRASLAILRDAEGTPLDEALLFWFPGPASATGEDLAELHCHGGRAVIRAVEQALGMIPGLRRAEPGEFTRRAFANGRMDLAEAEGLADLLMAQTEWHRASALSAMHGSVSAQIEAWRSEVLGISAKVEAQLDFADEDDVGADAELEARKATSDQINEFRATLDKWLAKPLTEKLSEGFRVALAGPPNAGKSTLFNALVESDAAITSDIAGTTRDIIERPVSISGIPFSFVDTAGLRIAGEDPIEALGIGRAQEELVRADLVLWLGSEGEGPSASWEIAARADADNFIEKRSAKFTVSAETGDGLEDLKKALVAEASQRMPKPGEAALNQRQHQHLAQAAAALRDAGEKRDWLLIGEDLRRARLCFDRMIGRATTEDMLDSLFGRFCIGK